MSMSMMSSPPVSMNNSAVKERRPFIIETTPIKEENSELERQLYIPYVLLIGVLYCKATTR